MNDGFKARKGSKKIVDIELQYEEENDKTLLQVAVDEGKVEALQVTILGTYHSIVRFQRNYIWLNPCHFN